MLRAERVEVVCTTGPSGRGGSALLRVLGLMLGLDLPDEPTGSLDEESGDLAARRQREVRW